MEIKAKVISVPRSLGEENQDGYYINLEKGVFAVLDGVSGSDDGKFACDFIKEELEKRSDQIYRLTGIFPSHVKKEVDAMDSLLFQKNQEVGKGALTTLSLLAFSKGTKNATVTNAGDSRIYRYRKRDFYFEQISRDDSFVFFKEKLKREKVDPSKLTDKQRYKIQNDLDNATQKSDLDKDELWFWDKRGNITNAMGNGRLKQDTRGFKFKEDDVFVLMTDGVYDNLPHKEMQKIVKENKDDIGTIVDLLFQRALEESTSSSFRASHDDITVIGIKIE